MPNSQCGKPWLGQGCWTLSHVTSPVPHPRDIQAPGRFPGLGSWFLLPHPKHKGLPTPRPSSPLGRGGSRLLRGCLPVSTVGVALGWACSGAGVRPRVLPRARLRAPSSTWAGGLARLRFSLGVISPQSLAFCTLVGCREAQGGSLGAPSWCWRCRRFLLPTQSSCPRGVRARDSFLKPRLTGQASESVKGSQAAPSSCPESPQCGAQGRCGVLAPWGCLDEAPSPGDFPPSSGTRSRRSGCEQGWLPPLCDGASAPSSALASGGLQTGSALLG